MNTKKRPSMPSPQGVLPGYALAVESARQSAIHVDSRGWCYDLSRHTTGVASDYMEYLPELLTKTDNRRVVLCCRSSVPTQERKGNLRDAVMSATEALEKLGCEIVDVVADVENSRISNPKRPSLERAFARAHWLEAILVFPERDRALRSGSYRGMLRHPVTGCDLETPSVAEFRIFARKAGGLQVGTLTHPDAPARPVQIKRGQRQTEARIGRPKALTQGAGKHIRRRAALESLAVQLLLETQSLREARKALNHGSEWPDVSHRQLKTWAAKLGVQFFRTSGRWEAVPS